MASVRSIISNNKQTFYNFRTGDRLRVWPRIALTLVLSPVLAFFLTENVGGFVDATNTILSNLLGFAFSVLFYLASIKGNSGTAEHQSLEAKNRSKRLDVLSVELFHNVSYFVFVASASLAVSLIVIAPEAHGDWFSEELSPLLEGLHPRIPTIVHSVEFAVRSVFFFLVIEAAYTFARIVGRVNFLFEEKLRETG